MVGGAPLGIGTVGTVWKGAGENMATSQPHTKLFDAKRTKNISGNWPTG